MNYFPPSEVELRILPWSTDSNIAEDVKKEENSGKNKDEKEPTENLQKEKY